MLAKKGANVDYLEEHGYTPLAHTDSVPVATALLDLGASVEGSSLRPSMPMTFAIMRDDLGKGDLHAHTYLKHIRHMERRKKSIRKTLESRSMLQRFTGQTEIRCSEGSEGKKSFI